MKRTNADNYNQIMDLPSPSGKEMEWGSEGGSIGWMVWMEGGFSSICWHHLLCLYPLTIYNYLITILQSYNYPNCHCNQQYSFYNFNLTIVDFAILQSYNCKLMVAYDHDAMYVLTTILHWGKVTIYVVYVFSIWLFPRCSAQHSHRTSCVVHLSCVPQFRQWFLIYPSTIVQ